MSLQFLLRKLVDKNLLKTHTNCMKKNNIEERDKKIKKPWISLKGILLAFVLSFVIPFMCVFCFNNFLFDEDKLESGYSVCGVDLSGLTTDEAGEKLKTLLTADKNFVLTLTHGKRKWQFRGEDFEVHSNIFPLVAQLENLRGGSVREKSKILKKIKSMGFDNSVAINYVLLDMDKKIDNISHEIESPAVDAMASYNKTKKKFDLSNEKSGKMVDRKKLYDDISLRLQNLDNTEIKISLVDVPAKITYEDVQKSLKKQSHFETNYATSNYARKNNIAKAVDSLCGTKILPGETFSFNDTIGKRTTSTGYKEANIIKDGAFVKGVGGGVCQVSSTLYNALLLANINVTEAHKHSLPVSYVSAGLDAMVSWGSADLKFVNTTESPIYIVGSADGNKIVFEIYGDTNPENLTIKTKSQIIKSISPQADKIIPDVDGKYADKIMFKGEYLRIKKPKDGYEAVSSIEYYKDGKLQRTKQLRHATYDAQRGVLVEGCDKLPDGMTLPKQNVQ